MTKAKSEKAAVSKVATGNTTVVKKTAVKTPAKTPDKAVKATAKAPAKAAKTSNTANDNKLKKTAKPAARVADQVKPEKAEAKVAAKVEAPVATKKTTKGKAVPKAKTGTDKAARSANASGPGSAVEAKSGAAAQPRPRLASGSSGPTLAPAPSAPSRPKPSANTGSKPLVATKPATPQSGFKAGDFIVYPAHGVGQIVAIEKQEVAGFTLELFVINFLQDKLTLKVPLLKVLEGAIRKLSDPAQVKKALDTLTGRARIKRTMWSRRAQEYEAKINSGDLVTISEVVRDLYRSDSQPEQSYSERQLYEAALDRMAREVAVVRKLGASEALKLIEEHLQRGPRRGAKAAADEEADSTGDTAEDIGEAA